MVPLHHPIYLQEKLYIFSPHLINSGMSIAQAAPGCKAGQKSPHSPASVSISKSILLCQRAAKKEPPGLKGSDSSFSNQMRIKIAAPKQRHAGDPCTNSVVFAFENGFVQLLHLGKQFQLLNLFV